MIDNLLKLWNDILAAISQHSCLILERRVHLGLPARIRHNNSHIQKAPPLIIACLPSIQLSRNVNPMLLLLNKCSICLIATALQRVRRGINHLYGSLTAVCGSVENVYLLKD